jgi:hypothetical protein
LGNKPFLGVTLIDLPLIRKEEMRNGKPGDPPADPFAHDIRDGMRRPASHGMR